MTSDGDGHVYLPQPFAKPKLDAEGKPVLDHHGRPAYRAIVGGAHVIADDR